MTFAVDWVLKANYLSIFPLSLASVPQWGLQMQKYKIPPDGNPRQAKVPSVFLNLDVSMVEFMYVVFTACQVELS